MDGITIVLVATLTPAVITLGVARWKQNNRVSKSIGGLQGHVEGLGKTLAAWTTANEGRIKVGEERMSRLEDRLDAHIDEHAKGGE